MSDNIVPLEPPWEKCAPIYMPMVVGKRVEHRHYAVTGRLTGDVKNDRGTCFFETATPDGIYWWARNNVRFLGPIPVPAPRMAR